MCCKTLSHAHKFKLYFILLQLAKYGKWQIVVDLTKTVITNFKDTSKLFILLENMQNKMSLIQENKICKVNKRVKQ